MIQEGMKNLMMKAITIYQPYAKLLAIGAKQFETRGWPTKYRGPIAIHASVKDPWQVINGLTTENKRRLLKFMHLFYGINCGEIGSFPRGAVIATAELVDVFDICEIGGVIVAEKQKRISKERVDFLRITPTEQEIAFGDWRLGRYAWQLANVRLLPEPIFVKGKQGLWNWEDPQIEEEIKNDQR